MEVLFDEQRALRVFSTLDELWKNNQWPFDNILLPDEMIVRSLEVPQQNSLFFAALFMRGGVISEDPIRLVNQLLIDYPAIFHPDQAKDLGEQQLVDIFEEVSVKIKSLNGDPLKKSAFRYKAGEYARSWIFNARLLAEEFKGDPLSIFKDTGDFEEAFGRVSQEARGKKSGLQGMRRKIFSLFTIWLQTQDLLPKFPTPIPVDFHALRVLWATGIFEILDPAPLASRNGKLPVNLFNLCPKEATQTKERLVDTVAKWSQGFLARNKLAHGRVNPALWVLSRDLCASFIQNISVGKPRFRQEQKRSYHLLLDEEYLNCHPKLWDKEKAQSLCYVCPIREFCGYAVPAGPYYSVGVLVRIPKRKLPDQPPQGVLPGIVPTEAFLKKGRARSPRK